MSARENVLGAYAQILAEDGERGATLEAVAARAGVSKGGLLYHFGSKEALAEGLLERLGALVDADIEEMRASSEGPSVYYVRTSVYADTPLDLALVAVTRLASRAHEGAGAALDAGRRRWLELIEEEVGDRARAHAILLIGDGLYYEAAYSGQRKDAPVAQMDALLGVVRALVVG